MNLAKTARRALLGLIASCSMLGSGLAIAAGNPKVEFATTSGSFVIELYPDAAPKTVANFLQYVKDHQYDGTIFHRVIPGFMVQGGGYDASFTEKRARAPVEHEGRQAYAKGLRNVAGSVAMARTDDPQSAKAQFFINTADNGFLDPTPIPPGDPVASFQYQGRTYTNVPRAKLEGATQLYGYTVFGKVVSGMDTVEKIRKVPTGAGGPFPTDVPKATQSILSAKILP